MPAKNPRLTITLDPAVHAQLRRMSELTGNSQSALIAELLHDSGPIFERLILVLEAAEGVKQEMKGKLASDMAQAQAKLEAGLGLQLEVFDGYTGNLLEQVEAVKRRGRRREGEARLAHPAAPAAVTQTPPSNRGVRSTNPKTKVNKTRG